ncbi:MAG TPA: SDR family NAD(P)-dependent oxidoreductase, partial [Ohtaekwangia sp.]|nr:SDR family NAD(P)-dependent oxidoreductase [Ohtaekwangia sp.]
SVETAIKVYKKIDVAILLVGGFAMGDIAHTDGDILKKMYTLNFETAYHTARPIFLQMMKQVSGGRIILVGAKPALNAKQGKDMIAYGLSKSLLFKLAEYLNAEGSTNNVVTSVIIPSTIDTPQNRASMPDAEFDNWVKPQVIAEIMAFICSDHGMALREPIFKVYGKS